MVEALGFLAMILMGVVLGALGAGGSILTLPILVYLFGLPASAATGYSLAIVGATALAGGLNYLRQGQASLRAALEFGVPAVAAVYLTRRFLFPAIPDPIVAPGGLAVSKDTALMLLFAAFMMAAAAAMLRGEKGRTRDEKEPRLVLELVLLVVLGFIVGVLTGLIGAGGGFMILPVLVLLGGLPVKVAIGTDLLIIAAKSLVGFVGEVQAVEDMDYGFVGIITATSLMGMVFGTRLNRRTPAPVLRAAFGWFVLVMGSYIVLREGVFG
jgi:uncharacterized membrane protein YfcA